MLTIQIDNSQPIARHIKAQIEIQTAAVRPPQDLDDLISVSRDERTGQLLLESGGRKYACTEIEQ